MNNILDILESCKHDAQRSFALNLRKACERLLKKRWHWKEFMYMTWNTSWGVEYEYFLEVTSSEEEMDLYNLVQDTRWKMR